MIREWATSKQAAVLFGVFSWLVLTALGEVYKRLLLNWKFTETAADFVDKRVLGNDGEYQQLAPDLPNYTFRGTATSTFIFLILFLLFVIGEFHWAGWMMLFLSGIACISIYVIRPTNKKFELFFGAVFASWLICAVASLAILGVIGSLANLIRI